MFFSDQRKALRGATALIASNLGLREMWASSIAAYHNKTLPPLGDLSEIWVRITAQRSTLYNTRFWKYACSGNTRFWKYACSGNLPTQWLYTCSHSNRTLHEICECYISVTRIIEVVRFRYTAATKYYTFIFFLNSEGTYIFRHQTGIYEWNVHCDESDDRWRHHLLTVKFYFLNFSLRVHVPNFFTYYHGLY